jgi:hypothetical protein
MAGRGAPKGSRNAAKGKDFENAIRRALAQDPERDVLREIARKVVEEALTGNLAAIGMVADRLDGKPAQSLEVTNNEPDRSPEDLSESALDARIAAVERRLAGEEVQAEGSQQLN